MKKGFAYVERVFENDGLTYPGMHVWISFARLLNSGAYLLVLGTIRDYDDLPSTSSAAGTTAIACAVVWHCGRRCEVDVGEGLLVNYFGDFFGTWGEEKSVLLLLLRPLEAFCQELTAIVVAGTHTITRYEHTTHTDT